MTMGALIGFGRDYEYAVEVNTHADGTVDYTLRYAMPHGVVRLEVVQRCPHIAITAQAFDARINAKVRAFVDELEL